MRTANPYQIIGAKYIVDNKRSLLADEMGVGKTAQAIMAKSLIEKQKNKNVSTLVICPNSVKEHWENEIRKWYYKENANILTIDGNLEYRDLDKIVKQAKESDFVIINYDILSMRNSKRGRKILDELKKVKFDYIIGDEIHNAKNPQAYRTKSVKEIADNSEYLALLSGTPIPNSIVNIYMIMSLIEPEKYRMDFGSSSKILRLFYNIYKTDPESVKRIFSHKKLRRLAEDYIKKEVPKVEYKNLEVRLIEDHEKIYTDVYNNDNISVETKLRVLLKASLDPSLVDPKYITDPKLKKRLKTAESCKYKKLDKIIEEETKNGGKVLVFSSHFKKGVTDKLLKRYKQYGSCVIDGDVDTARKNGEDSEREKIRKRFQNDENYKVLFATTETMNEGVDLTRATTIIFLDKPYTPSSFDQAVKRSQRRGEFKKGKLKVYSLIAKNHVPTIDQGIEKLLEDKGRIIKYLLSGFTVSKEELELIANGKVSNLKPIRNTVRSSRYLVTQHYMKWRDLGAERIAKHIEKYPDIQKEIIKLYLTDFWDSLQGNTAKIIKETIEKLEEKTNLEKKLDICCGPGVLSMSLGKPTVGVDIDPYAIKMAKKVAHKDSTYHLAPAHKIPYKNEHFDLAVCSLAYQMFSLKRTETIKEKVGKRKIKIQKELKEREAFLRESNRVLRKNGYLIITIPKSTFSEEDLSRYKTGLSKLGFEIKPELTGFVNSKNNNNDFNIYRMCLQKKSNPISEELKENQFKMHMDSVFSNSSKIKVMVDKRKEMNF